MAELADEGQVIGTSNDVNWHGFIVTVDEGRERYNLEEWIENNQAELQNPNLPNDEPKQSEYEDESTWFNAYVEWQTDCENEFRFISQS
jgi:hypothetical protein